MIVSDLLRALSRLFSRTSGRSPERSAPDVPRASAAPLRGDDSVSSSDFLTVSCFLTGKNDLSPAVAARAYAALSSADATFAASVSDLLGAICTGRLADMKMFDDFARQYPEPAAAALHIISAWYLGYTGTPEPLCSEDDSAFVAYESALMFRPTADVTAPPSYTPGRTDYWQEPPASLKSDRTCLSA
ncbi:sorbitol dehydrogenase family protein [Acetobacter sp. AN02]|uniref:sugar dehydrogenase complex small subunit n=1 Tax=Acetobacter sp. AN02 TaxID=2894186 RepID=UPI0024341063|nr:sugar dehydrogenase complex small subunit [Acetobacter sp. AN02]MDG6095015.1 sorbitol dehydrogenase family protein [Acetobacter sp. AN02]